MSLEDWTETFVLASRTSAASQTSHSTVLATSDRCALNANDQRGPAGLRRADDRFHFGRTQQAEPSATFAVLNSSPRSGRSNPDRRPCGACSGGRKPVGGMQASLAQRSDVARPTEARNHVLALRATVPCSVFCGSPGPKGSHLVRAGRGRARPHMRGWGHAIHPGGLRRQGAVRNHLDRNVAADLVQDRQPPRPARPVGARPAGGGGG
jgi:hypothetical protein